MARLALRLAVGSAILYGLDEVSLRAGIPSRPQFSSYTISRFYFVNENFNKFSYEPRPSIEERCVNALFPHMGSRPCWYVSRHTKETTAVN